MTDETLERLIHAPRPTKRQDLDGGRFSNWKRWERSCCQRHRLRLTTGYWRRLRRTQSDYYVLRNRGAVAALRGHPIAPRCSACGLSIDPRKWPDGPLWNKIEERYVNAYRDQMDAEEKQRKEDYRRAEEARQKRAAERKAVEDARLINRARRSLLANAIFYSFVFYGILALFAYLK